jgi:redox-regulated HSP33 family molecular chaperone
VPIISDKTNTYLRKQELIYIVVQEELMTLIHQVRSHERCHCNEQKCVLIFMIDTDSNPGQVVKKKLHNPWDHLQSCSLSASLLTKMAASGRF